MGSFNFADSYKAAGLNPGPEIIRLRQEPFKQLCEDLNIHVAIDLTRLYFGLPIPQGTDWFRDNFTTTDPSFSMIDNEQEVAVLAACILSHAIHNEDEIAALAILTTSANGSREPLTLPELIEDARTSLLGISINQRQRKTSSILQLKIPNKSNIQNKTEEISKGVGWDEVADLFNQIHNESSKTAKNIATQIQDVLFPVVDQVADLKEEISMLWWHIGGWSRLLEKPLIQLEPGLAAIMAGLDLADLSQTYAGPAAATAILHRTVVSCCDKDSTSTSIKDAIEAFPESAFDALKLNNDLNDIADVCPILAGLLKMHEIGSSPAWEVAFGKAAKLDASLEFGLVELAVQVYRERSLLSAID